MAFFDFFKKKTKKQEEKNAPFQIQKNDMLNLGDFTVNEADYSKIKSVAINFVPDQNRLYSVDDEMNMLKALSAVMDISVTEIKTKDLWDAAKNCSEDDIKNRLFMALATTIASVDQSLSFMNPDFLKKKVACASYEELIKAWFSLYYYSRISKPDFSENIKYFRDYIQNTLVKKFKENLEDFKANPIKIEENRINIISREVLNWKRNNPNEKQYELCGVIQIKEKEPVIYLFEDGVKTMEYRLETEGDEDFSGKYFHYSVRVGILGNPPLPLTQIDGFVSDTPDDDKKMTIDDIGYRMEGHFLVCGGEKAKKQTDLLRGQDLVMKGLKYAGHTTPANVRLIGICPECNKSFCFHGYAFYMAQSDIAYSDDGLDCCEIQAYDIDKDTWTYEEDGKTFRYYNSFNCPHCATPYIDYKKYPENKVFGASGCVHLGRKYYTAK